MDFAAVDISDTGGAATESQTHPDFRDGTGSTRLSYLHDFSSDFSFHPNEPNLCQPTTPLWTWHTERFDRSDGFNNNRAAHSGIRAGFQYGLGVAPFAQIGVSKLFNDRGDFRTELYLQRLPVGGISRRCSHH